MIRYLQLKNVGPASEMELVFGERLNILTGDNGLGKSFLLDIAWWALTRKWPADINPDLTAGKKALPSSTGKAAISFSFTGKSKKERYESTFMRKEQAWTGRPGRPANPGLVLYAMADGSFAVWDPARNYWRTQGGIDVQDRPPAYVFAPNQVWDGLPGSEGNWLCNGLIRDWGSWQKENGRSFSNLRSVLKALAPSERESLIPGELTRISLDDVRDMPTIHMPYEQDVPVVHASSGMRRIMALGYFLVWAWEEHQKAARLLGEKATSQVVFLIDEIESHLHPNWQRRIAPALIKVVDSLAKPAQVQVLTATHSPLIMASVEQLFDDKKDAWFDLDYESEGKKQKVILTHRDFVKHGDVCNWLTSEAFDMPSSGSIEYERLLSEASDLLEKPNLTGIEAKQMHQKLIAALSPKNSFLLRWRAICEKRGLLK
jgi:predicted ATPase